LSAGQLADIGTKLLGEPNLGSLDEKSLCGCFSGIGSRGVIILIEIIGYEYVTR